MTRDSNTSTADETTPVIERTAHVREDIAQQSRLHTRFANDIMNNPVSMFAASFDVYQVDNHVERAKASYLARTGTTRL